MANKLMTEKYNNNIGKTYKGLEIISWERAEDKKNITYTLKNPTTGETYKKSHSNIYKDLEEVTQKKTFNLKELKPGMIIETKNNKKCLVTAQNLINLEDGSILTDVRHYHETLNHKFVKDLTISKVFDNIAKMTLLYKRPTYKLTNREQKYIEAAVLLGFKYIFRNKNQDVYVANRKPEKGGTDWVFNTPVYLTRLSTLLSVDFEFIKWSDDEPTPISELI